MFTGLVQVVGRVESLTRRGPGFRLTVAAVLPPLALGESVAVNGACLTVAVVTSGGFEADVSLETASRTNLGALRAGAKVNLEQALRLGDRVGGHLVSGHVDAVVGVRAVTAAGEAQRVAVDLPPDLRPYLAPKGSVTLDGVSLTINDVHQDSLEVMVIPHTLAATTLAQVSPGRSLNLEVDLLARYVVAALGAPGVLGLGTTASPASGGLSTDTTLIEALRRSGLM
jgi:riboflavin synthase